MLAMFLEVSGIPAAQGRVCACVCVHVRACVCVHVRACVRVRACVCVCVSDEPAHSQVMFHWRSMFVPPHASPRAGCSSAPGYGPVNHKIPPFPLQLKMSPLQQINCTTMDLFSLNINTILIFLIKNVFECRGKSVSSCNITSLCTFYSNGSNMVARADV